jgi:PTS system galactitol-specific IIC component
MDVDIWNFWHSMMIAGALYLTTKSMILALLSAVINMAIVFKIADWTQNDLDEVLGLEGISFPQIQSSGWALIGYPLNWLFDRIPGVKNISWTPEKVQSKLGIFGEPMLIGLFVGGILAAAARMPLDQILQTAVTIAASLVLMPRMVALLMDGLTLISESAQEWMQKRFEGRELYIGWSPIRFDDWTIDDSCCPYFGIHFTRKQGLAFSRFDSVTIFYDIRHCTFKR